MAWRAPPSKFESAVLEQLDAAYNLARWLMRNEQDAEDVVQESCMKAIRNSESFRGGDFRAWFLTIVRNSCYSTLSRKRGAGGAAGQQSLEVEPEVAADEQLYDPHAIAVRAANADWVRRAIDALPVALREVVVLRELQGLNYKEIAKVLAVPIGTVMSRLARGRAQLQARLLETDDSAREGAP